MKGPLFCLVYALIYKNEPRHEKHGPTGVACIYHGYDDRNDQYKVKEWLSGRVYYTADAVFHPTIFPYRSTPELSSKWIREMDLLSPNVPVSENSPAPHSMSTGPRRSMRQNSSIYSGNKNLVDLSEAEIQRLAVEEEAVQDAVDEDEGRGEESAEVAPLTLERSLAEGDKHADTPGAADAGLHRTTAFIKGNAPTFNRSCATDDVAEATAFVVHKFGPNPES